MNLSLGMREYCIYELTLRTTYVNVVTVGSLYDSLELVGFLLVLEGWV